MDTVILQVLIRKRLNLLLTPLAERDKNLNPIETLCCLHNVVQGGITKRIQKKEGNWALLLCRRWHTGRRRPSTAPLDGWFRLFTIPATSSTRRRRRRFHCGVLPIATASSSLLPVLRYRAVFGGGQLRVEILKFVRPSGNFLFEIRIPTNSNWIVWRLWDCGVKTKSVVCYPPLLPLKSVCNRVPHLRRRCALTANVRRLN